MTGRCISYGPEERSPGHLHELVEQFRGDLAKRWRPHDVTGDGLPETFCNQFVEAVALAARCYLPRVLLANAQISWLASSSGREAGWQLVDRAMAKKLTELGHIVVAAWFNTAGKHGHVAICVPSPVSAPADALHIAQAGKRCFIGEPLEKGFGDVAGAVQFFAHP